MINRLTDTLDFQAKALVLRSERQRILASNIANADTPGFVAREMDFASALREATGQASSAAAMSGASLTDAGHLPLSAQGAAALALKYSAPAQTNLDSNSVDMDRERASFVDNSVKYESSLRFINAHVKYMLDAMKSPSQG